MVNNIQETDIYYKIVSELSPFALKCIYSAHIYIVFTQIWKPTTMIRSVTVSSAHIYGDVSRC